MQLSLNDACFSFKKNITCGYLLETALIKTLYEYIHLNVHGEFIKYHLFTKKYTPQIKEIRK